MNTQFERTPFGDRQFQYRNAIIETILSHNNFVHNDIIYKEILNRIKIYPYELEPTNHESRETKYRGSVRKHISDMRKEGVIETTDEHGIKRKRGHYQKILNPELYRIY